MPWEDNLRETLENRRLEPSKASWDVLAKRLDTIEKNKTHTTFRWVGIAAGLIGILLASLIFLKDGSGTVPQVPETVKVQLPVEEAAVAVQKQQDQMVSGSLQTTTNTALQAHKTEMTSPQDAFGLSATIKPTPPEAENEARFLGPDKPSEEERFEDLKVKEVVAQIHDLKSKGHTVTDADIEALLQAAQIEIAYQKSRDENRMAVDANALLQEVEDELQQSFRNKIFEALKNSYESIKTAVAERNN